MRRVGLLALLLACRGTSAPPSTQAGSGAGSDDESRDAAPRVRTDRPPARLGGPPTWAQGNDFAALSVCPSDLELVGLDEAGWLRRYRIANGEQLSAVDLGTPPPSWRPRVHCGANDDTATVDPQGAPIVVDRWASIRPAPGPLVGRRAWHGTDGAIWIDANDGVHTWKGPDVARAFEHPAGDHLLIAADAYLELGVGRGATLRRGTQRTKIASKLVATSEGLLSPDGKTLVLLGDAGKVEAWSLGARPRLLFENPNIDGAAISNEYIVLRYGPMLLTYYLPTEYKGAIDRPCGDRFTRALAFAHDHHHLAIACQGMGLRMFDLASSTQTTDDPPLSAAVSLAWSPSNIWLAARASDATVIVWDTLDQVVRKSATAGTHVWWRSESQVGFATRDGQFAWTIPQGPMARHEPQLPAGLQLLAISDDGRIVLTAPTDPAGKRLRATVGGVAREIELPGPISTGPIALASSGRRAVLSHPGVHAELIDVDLVLGKAVAIQLAHTAIAVDDDAIYYATEPGRIVRWTPKGDSVIGQHAGAVHALAIHDDVIAAGGADGKITLWSTRGEALGALAGHEDAVRVLAFASDGRLASSGRDTTLVWDLRP